VRVRTESFDRLDGVPGIPAMLVSKPSVIETSEGRLWLMMMNGIVSIDPTQLTHNTLPPPVRIWSLASGAAHFPDVRAALSLPANTTDLQIDYSAGSLTVPERVNFRYKLEGSDRDWQDVGTRREARYTNLGPGHYTFRVIASNNDGVWKFQAAAERIPPGEPARQLMEQTLDRADELLAESRDKVKDLRPASQAVLDLAKALAAEVERFSELHPAQCRVSVQGNSRDLHPTP
jgi:hypothetical protein